MSEPANASSDVILTCAQPSGDALTLGNYFGAVKNWVSFLDAGECYFGIVDMHSITVPYKPAELRQNTLRLAAQYIACGLDPAKCHLFVQSHVTGHTELAWVLGCVTPLGQLERMTQFKDKSARAEEKGFIGAGLLYYPVLMAADILLYNADKVPVGEDQKQHVELTRDLAERFNNAYSETFTVPEVVIPKTGARIKSLQEPERKMSKSDVNQNATLFLLDPPERLTKKIKSAVTDTGSDIVFRDDKPGISNLLTILGVTSGTTVEALEKEYAGKGYADFKAAVAESVVECLRPIQTRFEELMADKGELERILASGAEAAQKRACKTLSKVYRKAGFLQRSR